MILLGIHGPYCLHCAYVRLCVCVSCASLAHFSIRYSVVMQSNGVTSISWRQSHTIHVGKPQAHNLCGIHWNSNSYRALNSLQYFDAEVSNSKLGRTLSSLTIHHDDDDDWSLFRLFGRLWIFGHREHWRCVHVLGGVWSERLFSRKMQIRQTMQASDFDDFDDFDWQHSKTEIDILVCPSPSPCLCVT